MRRKATPLRLGIYGGTFDPVHLGHLLLAHDALEQLKLDAVLFVPARQSPFKAKQPGATTEQRVAMLKLALKGREKFWLSRCEIDRPAPSYAFDTASEIQAAFPRAELLWLIGADQLPDLHDWHRAKELGRLVTFALLPRGGETTGRIPAKVLSLPRPRRVDISATEIRHRVKSHLPIDLLVPAPIAAYIQRHRLYLA
jgi:nicotinate-nucleotide adenylyltransferase